MPTDSMPKSSDEPVIKSAVEARQGDRSRDLSYMLFISVSAAAAMLAVVCIAFVI